MNISKIYRILIPGLVFQSVIVAGGYGTGRELAEFFLSLGPKEGILGLIMAALIWSCVAACCYVYALKFSAYDYRTFFKNLLGRAWLLFEFSYVMVVIIVLSVIAAACGSLGESLLKLDYNVGLLIIFSYISYMVLRGSRAIERMFSFWSLMLYLVFAMLFLCSYLSFGGSITDNLSQPLEGLGWIKSGIEYAGYNLGLIPATFFALRHLKNDKEAILAGGLTGVIAVIPGILFYLAMLGHYPGILAVSVPSTVLLDSLAFNFLTVIYSLVLLGTLIETAVGLIHALNERIEIQYQVIHSNKNLPSYIRPVISMLTLMIALVLAQVGLEELVSTGYRFLTWLILAIFIVPLFTVGLKQMNRATKPKYFETLS